MRMKPVCRKLIALFLLFAMLLPLSACSFRSGESGPAPSAQGASETAAPTPEPTPEPTPYVVPADLPLRISEVMPSNKATLASGNDFPDWVELHNAGNETISLRGVFLCCGTDSFELGDGELGADGYMVVFCDDSGLPAHASFSISKEGESLALRTDSNLILDEFELPACGSDRSACRGADGEIFISSLPTPGFENSFDGYARRQEALVCDSPLQINEVMTFNMWYPGPNKNCYDWVEVKNVSGGDVQLSEYYLSPNSKEPFAFQLPNRVLASGDFVMIYFVGDRSFDDEVHTIMGLNAVEDQLYLTRSDGALMDYAILRDIPYHGSYGRMNGSNGFYFFTVPTPGADNSGGLRRVAESPVLLSEEGVFNGVESVEVVLSADGEIRYTTDGSVPTRASALYEGPFTVSSTTVVRAVNFEPDCIESEPLNLSYIINENHTLPVVSLMADPDAMLSRSEGMYYDIQNEIEIPGAVEFFEEDGSFSIQCGIKLHGVISKAISDKKSMKLCFRSRYEGHLNYDLFDNGVTEYAYILLRHPAEDRMSTYLRDILIHDMAKQCFPALPFLDYKFSILYINGQYWGIYGIREAHSRDHYANHFGYDPDTVSSWKRLWDRSTDVGQACEFALYNDLTNEENYNYVSQYIDIDSVVAWVILQAWCGNIDCNPSNVRYYYSTEDHKLHYGLSDLDLGMFSYDLFDVPLLGSVNDGVRNNYDFNILTRKLFENRDFQLRTAQALSDAFRGPMSDSNVASMLEGYRAALSPEVARDLARWFPAMSESDAVGTWNILVDRLIEYATRNGGRSRQMLDSFIAHTKPRFTQEEIDYYFHDLR